MMRNFAIPSRDDAWLMTRREKCCLTFLMNTASSLMESKDDLADRLEKIENGKERMESLATESLNLLNDIRSTIPEKQRNSLANTAEDYEMRLVPKFTPKKTSVVVCGEDFKTLVDAAQTKCASCAELNEECHECKLFQLLTTILPLDRYDTTMLCPYNMARWED